jgi:hypothetical protein
VFASRTGHAIAELAQLDENKQRQEQQQILRFALDDM